MSQKPDNKKILNFKEMAKNRDKYKNFFRSRGVSTIKKTILENGEPKEIYVDIEISPVSDDPTVKEFMKKNPRPKPPVIRKYVNIKTGRDAEQDGIDPRQAKVRSDYQWGNVYDFTNEEYLDALENWNRSLMLLYIMIAFDVVEEFGIDKIDDFEKWLSEIGFTANQLNKLADDIKNLDFLSAEK